MANSEIEVYLRSRLQGFLPSTDVSKGSQADRYVVQPLLTKLGADPLSTDVRAFILSHLAAAYPDLDTTSAGSQIDDIILGPLQLLLEPFRREIAYVKASQSLSRPDLLSADEVGSLLANTFSSVQQGSRARGTARVYFSDKRTISVDGTTTVSAIGGLVFYAQDAFVLTSDTMALQVEDGLYYVDFDVEAASEGDTYNIDKNNLQTVSGLPGVVKVVNKDKFTGGLVVETPQDASARAKVSIGERSPNTDGGIYSKLTDLYSTLRAVKSIGYGDPEMVRDIIKGTVSLDETKLGVGPVVKRATLAAATPEDVLTPELSYLHIIDRTNRVVVASGVDFTDYASGSTITIEDDDRTFSVVSPTEVEVDDYKVIAKGTRGYTATGVSIITYGNSFMEHVLSSSFLDANQEFLLQGVTVGDYLRVQGTWDGTGGGPLPVDRNTIVGGPGNTEVAYFPVVGVSAGRLTITADLQGEVYLSGGVSPNNVTVDGGALTVILGGSSTVTFLDSPVVLPGDYISFYESTSYDPQEWEIDTVDTARQLTLVLGATPTDTAGTTRWAIRRGPANGGKSLTAWPLSRCVGEHEWAVIRLKQGVNPDTFAWLTPGATALSYSIRSKLTAADVEASLRLTIGSVPSGITFPTRQGVSIDVSASDEVHVGGCTDVYLYDPSISISSVAVQSLGDQEPVVSGTDLVGTAGTSIVSAASAAYTDVPANAVLVISEGADSGAYRIISSGGSPGSYRLDSNMTVSFSSTRYYITGEATLSLDSPRVPRTSGTALASSFQSKLVQDVGADFSTTEAGDVLSIEGGANDGTYIVSSVPSSSELLLTTVMNTNATGQTYSVYKPLERPSFPIRRITNVDILSPVGTSIGLTVPPKDPVDVRSFTFSNVGRGGVFASDSLTPYSPSALWIPGASFLSNSELILSVSPGDIVSISEGPNKGSYTVFFVLGNLLFISGLSPLREYLPSPLVEVYATARDDDSGDGLLVGEIVYAGLSTLAETHASLSELVAIGTVVSSTTGGDTSVVATIQLSGTAPFVGSIIKTFTGSPGLYTSRGSFDVASYSPNISCVVGPPSIGTARAYFLEPTMFEVRNENPSDPDTATLTSSDGKVFVPDHRINTSYLSAVDEVKTRSIRGMRVLRYSGKGVDDFDVGETVEADGTSAGIVLAVFPDDSTSGELWLDSAWGVDPVESSLGGNDSGAIATMDSFYLVEDSIADETADFYASGVEVGDLVELVSIPLPMLKALDDGLSVGGLTLSLSFDDGPAKTMTFTGANPVPGDRAYAPYGVIQQIAQAFSDLTVKTFTQSGSTFADLHSTKKITVVGGTSTGVSGGSVGLVPGATNVPRNTDLGYELSVKEITSKNILSLCKHEAGSPLPDLSFVDAGIKYRVSHRGVQRISAKEMSANVDDTGLYYMDIEVRSTEPGDGGNLADGTELTISGHRSLGYRLESRNEALTFSTAEEVDFKFTGIVQDPDADDGPDSYQNVLGEGIRITYERDSTVSYAQSTLLRDTDRVICNNPLAKSMLPAYFRTALSYSGGEKAAVVKQDVIDLVGGVQPTTELQVSQIYDLLSKRGATRVTGPVEILAVRHNTDRTVNTVRSKDRLSTGRTAKLIPDVIKVTRG